MNQNICNLDTKKLYNYKFQCQRNWGERTHAFLLVCFFIETYYFLMVFTEFFCCLYWTTLLHLPILFYENVNIVYRLKIRPVVFKLCAAALWGAVRNLKGAVNFFRKDEILQFFYRNLLGCAAKIFWSLSGCREPKSLKTTRLDRNDMKHQFLHTFLKYRIVSISKIKNLVFRNVCIQYVMDSTLNRSLGKKIVRDSRFLDCVGITYWYKHYGHILFWEGSTPLGDKIYQYDKKLKILHG